MSPFPSSPPPSLPQYKPPPPLQRPQPPTMAEEGKWETFDDDDDDNDSLSLIDFPKKQEERKPSDGIEEFEFRTFGGGGSLAPKSEMCAADEIFSNGQLLPSSFRRSSVGSRRSNSNSSHSSSSNSSNSRRISVSNNFYAHPSPKPQLRTTAARRSTGSAPPGWALFRVGLVKTPEIELGDLRSRRMKTKNEKKYDNMSTALFGFGCGCGQDAVQPMMPVSRHNEKEEKKEKEEIMWRSRMTDWLEELSIGKGV